MLKTGPRVSRGFSYVSYPPRIELWTLDKNSKKENEKECVKAVLYIVILEYSLYSKLSCCIRFIQRVLESCKTLSSRLVAHQGDKTTSKFYLFVPWIMHCLYFSFYGLLKHRRLWRKSCWISLFFLFFIFYPYIFTFIMLSWKQTIKKEK